MNRSLAHEKSTVSANDASENDGNVSSISHEVVRHRHQMVAKNSGIFTDKIDPFSISLLCHFIPSLLISELLNII